jgi:selenide,water dikinase
MSRIDLTGGMGCACKIDSAKLQSVLSKIPRKPDDNLLVGYDHSDDGAVYKIDRSTAIIQTLDFFTPMSEDPYLFGQIAAANAMSDVYAMGGEVLTALNIVCFPEKENQEVLEEILKGGAEKVQEAGGCLVGGHSINDTSIKYGLSVCGTVHPASIFTNAGAQPGDSLVLTKPLGVGIINTANRVGEASPAALQKAVAVMTTLNKYAMDILKKYDVHACTDVTGFGLAGHGIELACASGVTLEMDAQRMHLIREAETYAADFLVSGAGQKNRNNYACGIDFRALSFARAELLFDAQTSGGLLAALPEEDAKKALLELDALAVKSAVIGKVISKQEKSIVFKGGPHHEDH